MSRLKFFFLLFFTIDIVRSETISVKIGTDSYVNLLSDKFLSFTMDPKVLFHKFTTKESLNSLIMASSLSPAYIRIAGPSTSLLEFKNQAFLLPELSKQVNIDESSATLESEKNTGKNIIKRSPAILTTNTKNKKVITDKNVIINNSEEVLKSDNSEIKLNEDKSISYDVWKEFVVWAKENKLDIVFAVNSDKKMASGIWDPNPTNEILSMAERMGMENIVWQLGYDCHNQTVQDYLNDLKTLQLMVSSFEAGSSGSWKVVAADITKCLDEESSTEFKDFVLRSEGMLDAVFLNGNASAYELEKLSDEERIGLLKTLSNSLTPLWLTESNITPKTYHEFNPVNAPKLPKTPSRVLGKIVLPKLPGIPKLGANLQNVGINNLRAKTSQSGVIRALDWLNSLGYSARNGFQVNFRELNEEELFEPSLSYYTSLIYKNLVGSKVLPLDLSPDSQASLFAHCTSLHGESVPGGVSLYGTNEGEASVRFSIPLHEARGGDLLQFILNQDINGNALINGVPIAYEGDIKPIVRRLLSYRSLLLNLPAKSIGFWVLLNTNINACMNAYDDVGEHQFVEATVVNNSKDIPASKTDKNILDNNESKSKLGGFISRKNMNDDPIDINKDRTAEIYKRETDYDTELGENDSIIDNNSEEEDISVSNSTEEDLAEEGNIAINSRLEKTSIKKFQKNNMSDKQEKKQGKDINGKMAEEGIIMSNSQEYTDTELHKTTEESYITETDVQTKHPTLKDYLDTELPPHVSNTKQIDKTTNNRLTKRQTKQEKNEKRQTIGDSIISLIKSLREDTESGMKKLQKKYKNVRPLKNSKNNVQNLQKDETSYSQFKYMISNLFGNDNQDKGATIQKISRNRQKRSTSDLKHHNQKLKRSILDSNEYNMNKVSNFVPKVNYDYDWGEKLNDIEKDIDLPAFDRKKRSVHKTKASNKIKIFQRSKRDADSLKTSLNKMIKPESSESVTDEILNDLKVVKNLIKKETPKKIKKMLNKVTENLPKLESLENTVNLIKNNEIIKENDYSSEDKPNDYADYQSNDPIEDQILVKTRITDDDASINLTEKSNHHGLIKIAFQNLASVIQDLKKHMNTMWSVMPFLS